MPWENDAGSFPLLPLALFPAPNPLNLYWFSSLDGSQVFSENPLRSEISFSSFERRRSESRLVYPLLSFLADFRFASACRLVKTTNYALSDSVQGHSKRWSIAWSHQTHYLPDVRSLLLFHLPILPTRSSPSSLPLSIFSLSNSFPPSLFLPPRSFLLPVPRPSANPLLNPPPLPPPTHNLHPHLPFLPSHPFHPPLHSLLPRRNNPHHPSTHLYNPGNPPTLGSLPQLVPSCSSRESSHPSLCRRRAAVPGCLVRGEGG